MKKARLLLTMALIVFSAVILCSMSAFALTDGDWEFQLLDNEVTITSYLGDDTEVIFPETIYGCPVTKIKGTVMLGEATKVVFPDTIKSIPSIFHDSYWNSELETVVLPEGVEYIQDKAFYNCKKLKYIVLPSTIKQIGSSAFEGCISLENINFPDYLNKIGDLAFKYSGIKKIDLNNVSECGIFAFSNCKQLETVEINKLTTIPQGMFENCSLLKKVDIQAPVTEIGPSAFNYCVSIKNIILPSSLKELNSPFFGCSGLVEIVIPYGVEEVGGFSNCANLKSLYIPDTVEKIYEHSMDKSDNCIIYCSENSNAAKDCKRYGISYLTDNSVNSGIHVLYNGTRISFHAYGQNPELLNSRTLVPLRSIFEAMGADVEWDGATNTAIAKRGSIEVKIQIGANEMYKNGKTIPVDVPAMLLNDRTMVPVRVIAEAFEADVQWNGNGNTVLITE